MANAIVENRFYNLPEDLRFHIYVMMLKDIRDKLKFKKWLEQREIWELIINSGTTYKCGYGWTTARRDEQFARLMHIAYGGQPPGIFLKRNVYFWEWFKNEATDWWKEENLPWEIPCENNKMICRTRCACCDLIYSTRH
jgi:hypothetical protein